jgi:hypothetical protein
VIARRLLALSIVVGLTASALAAPDMRVLEGEEAAKNVRELFTKVRWERSLADAQAAARASQKMILYVHSLGALDGDT